jgi:release factor glutamine methyltransferase
MTAWQSAALTVAVALAGAAARLAAAGADAPRLDAELLLAEATGWSRAGVLARGRQLLDAESVARYDGLVARRAAREPLAYILGRRAFYDLELAVDARVLIPRPETEHLVEAALAWVGCDPARAWRVADVGTGSGALAIALARRLPRARVVATDLSSAALAVARQNVAAYGLTERVALACADLLGGVEGPFDLVVTNLPYIARGELPTLMPEVSRYEPRLALDGGPDGLDLYRRLLPQLAVALAKPGLAVLECDPRQAEELNMLAARHLPAARLDWLSDYAGHRRALRLECAP